MDIIKEWGITSPSPACTKTFNLENQKMAKGKSGVNRSQAIRDAFKELPGAKAKEIVAHLKGKNITVSEQLVYQVKKIGKKKKPGRKPGNALQAKATFAAP